MTALDRYAKLEAVARYIDGRSETAREVVLSFGERSLIIMGLDDRPIAHWPLASLRALGAPATRPVELVPDPTSRERLLLDDREMSEAIAEVCPGLHLSPPPLRRRRSARPVFWAASAAIFAALALAPLLPGLPDRLVRFVAPEREQALGAALAVNLPPLLANGTAAPLACIADEGLAALRTLLARLSAPDLPWPLRVVVIDDPAPDAMALPGGRILLFRGLIESARSPEELAGVLAHAIGHERVRDPLRILLRGAGTAGIAGILVGDVAGASVVTETATILLHNAYLPDAEAAADETAFALLAAAGLPSRPYAELAGRLGGDAPTRWPGRHPWSRERAGKAAAADTIGGARFRPALRDRDWIALGNICERTAPLGPDTIS